MSRKCRKPIALQSNYSSERSGGWREKIFLFDASRENYENFHHLALLNAWHRKIKAQRNVKCFGEDFAMGKMKNDVTRIFDTFSGMFDCQVCKFFLSPRQTSQNRFSDTFQGDLTPAHRPSTFSSPNFTELKTDRRIFISLPKLKQAQKVCVKRLRRGAGLVRRAVMSRRREAIRVGAGRALSDRK